MKNKEEMLSNLQHVNWYLNCEEKVYGELRAIPMKWEDPVKSTFYWLDSKYSVMRKDPNRNGFMLVFIQEEDTTVLIDKISRHTLYKIAGNLEWAVGNGRDIKSVEELQSLINWSV